MTHPDEAKTLPELPDAVWLNVAEKELQKASDSGAHYYLSLWGVWQALKAVKFINSYKSRADLAATPLKNGDEADALINETINWMEQEIKNEIKRETTAMENVCARMALSHIMGKYDPSRKIVWDGRNKPLPESILKNCLKPEAVTGDDQTFHERMDELVRWFDRYSRGEANGKWLLGHAFELVFSVARLRANISPSPDRAKALECEKILFKDMPKLCAYHDEYGENFDFERYQTDMGAWTVKAKAALSAPDLVAAADKCCEICGHDDEACRAMNALDKVCGIDRTSAGDAERWEALDEGLLAQRIHEVICSNFDLPYNTTAEEDDKLIGKFIDAVKSALASPALPVIEGLDEALQSFLPLLGHPTLKCDPSFLKVVEAALAYQAQSKREV